MQTYRGWYNKGLFALALAGALSLGHVALPTVALADDAGTDEPVASAPATNEESSGQGEQQQPAQAPAAAPAATPTNEGTSGNNEVVNNAAPAQTVVDQTPAQAAPAEPANTEGAPSGEGEGEGEPVAAPASGEGTPTEGEAVANEPNGAPATEEGEDPAKAPADNNEAESVPIYNDPVADGATFYVETGATGKEAFVLDAKSGGKTDGTNMQMYTMNSSEAQRYIFEKAYKTVVDPGTQEESQVEDRDENGNIFYWIKRSGTELVLTVVGDAGAKGTNVALYEKDASLDGQKWQLVDMGNGLFKILSKLTTSDNKKLVLDVAGGAAKIAKGSNVQVWTDNGTAAQRFALLSTQAPVSNVTIESGVYTLKPKSNSSFSADVESGSIANGANVRLWTANGSAAQSLVITADGNGYYTIGILKSAKVFDVESGSMIPGANVRQWNYNGSDAQKWAIKLNADGSYSFLNKKSGLLLDIAGANIAKGTNLMTYRDTKTPAAQTFTLTRNTKADQNVLGVGDSVTSTDIFTISPAGNAGYVFDVKSGSKNPGGLIQLWTSNGSQAQRFQLELVGNNEYRIRTAASGDYLMDMGPLAQAQQGTSADTWQVVWNQGGYFALQNKLTGYVLDVRDGKYAKGTAIQTATSNSKVAQRFLFTKATLITPNYYYVEVRSGLTLDIANGSTAAGANVRLWTLNKSEAQKISIVKVGNYYRLIDLKSNKAIAGGGAADADGYSNVTQQTTSSTNKRQLWKVVVGNDGYIEFVNVATGFNLFARDGAKAKGDNVVEKDMSHKDYDDNIDGRSWKLVAATGWFKKNGHWVYVSSDSRAHFDNDVNGSGKSLGHYDILYTIWRYVNGKVSGSNKCFKSKTGYLICSSWDNCYIGIFKGKANVTIAENWEPLFGINCANGLPSKIEAQARIDKPGSTWKWDPNWDKNLGEGNANIKNMPEGSEWAYYLGYKKGQSTAKGSYNWVHSRKAKVSASERWFTSVSTTLGYHTFTGKESAQVGRHLSYGCQRMAEKYAKWIYDNIGPGTRCLQRTNKKLTGK